MAIHKSSARVYLWAIIVSFGGWTTGLFFTIYNATKSDMDRILTLNDANTPSIEGLLQSLIPLGGLIGGLISGSTAKLLGRRMSLLLVDIITIIGCILTMVTEFNIALILIGRFLCGLTVGLNWTIVTLFIRETSPANLSGRTGSFFKLFFAIGILTSYLLSFMLPTENKENSQMWRVVYFFPAIIAFARAMLLVFVITMDTPKWYIFKGNDYLAQAMLKTVYKDEYVTKIYEKEKKASRSPHTKEYFSGRYKRQFRLACMLTLIFQFTGINLVTFYSSDMFFKADKSISTSRIRQLNLLIGLIKVISAICAGSLADKFGRRLLFVSGIILITISTLFTAILGQLEISDGVKFFVIFYMAINSLSFSTILPLYLAEILPLNGCGLTVSFENFLIFIITYLYPILVNSLIGLFTMFYICTVVGIFGVVYVFMRVKETKGKKDIEIYNEFNTEGADVGLLDEDMIETLSIQGLSMADRTASRVVSEYQGLQ